MTTRPAARTLSRAYVLKKQTIGWNMLPLVQNIIDRLWLFLVPTMLSVWGAMISGAHAADAPTNPQLPADPEQLHRFLADIDQLRRLLPSSDFPLNRALVIGGVIALMAGLFWFLFYWQKNVEKSGYFANIYREAIEDIETDRHAVRFDRDWADGRYADELLYGLSGRAVVWAGKSENLMPTKTTDYQALCSAAQKLDSMPMKSRGTGNMFWLSCQERVFAVEQSMTRELYRLGQRNGSGIGTDGIGANPFADGRGGTTLRPTAWQPGQEGTGSGGFGEAEPQQAKPGDSEIENAMYEEFSSAYGKFVKSAQEWTDRAATCLHGWYSDDLQTVKNAAKQSAELALKVDISAIQGRGPEFILEFTAIIVIIFAAVILGVGSVLDSNQIGTLLAAIAGYVLGKAASRASLTSPTTPEAGGQTQNARDSERPGMRVQQLAARPAGAS